MTPVTSVIIQIKFLFLLLPKYEHMILVVFLSFVVVFFLLNICRVIFVIVFQSGGVNTSGSLQFSPSFDMLYSGAYIY